MLEKTDKKTIQEDGREVRIGKWTQKRSDEDSRLAVRYLIHIREVTGSSPSAPIVYEDCVATSCEDLFFRPRRLFPFPGVAVN